jgi:hypothetical protein
MEANPIAVTTELSKRMVGEWTAYAPGTTTTIIQTELPDACFSASRAPIAVVRPCEHAFDWFFTTAQLGQTQDCVNITIRKVDALSILSVLKRLSLLTNAITSPSISAIEPPAEDNLFWNVDVENTDEGIAVHPKTAFGLEPVPQIQTRIRIKAAIRSLIPGQELPRSIRIQLPDAPDE